MLFAYRQEVEAALLLKAFTMIRHNGIMPVLTLDGGKLYCAFKNAIHVGQVRAPTKIFLCKGNLRTEIW